MNENTNTDCKCRTTIHLCKRSLIKSGIHMLFNFMHKQVPENAKCYGTKYRKCQHLQSSKIHEIACSFKSTRVYKGLLYKRVHVE